MKKALFVASGTRHIMVFHIPYLKLLKENGYEVHVASFGEEEIPYCDKHFNLAFERSPLKKKNIDIWKELKKIIDNNGYDMIHCHTPTASVLTRLAAKKARKKGTKVVYTAHGFHFYKGAPLKNWIIFYPVEKYLSKYTDILITINKEDFELAQKRFGKRVKEIEYIPGMGVDEKKFCMKLSNSQKENLRKSLNIEKKNFVIIYPARLCKDKNQMLLLNFMREVNDSNVVLLLPGEDEFDGYYQKYVEDNKIQNVKFLGNRNDIPELIGISDLLIASSTREGFGINLVEALACEVPVIAVDNRGHREIIENGINGYLINNNVMELCSVFNMLYRDRNLYQKLEKNCYESAKKFFLSNSLARMKEIYKLS